MKDNTHILPVDARPELEVLESLRTCDGTSLCILYDRVCRRKLFMKSGERSIIENEAEMLERFAGDGVPAVCSCYVDGDTGYLLRRYIEGKSLREYIDENGTFSPKKATQIGIKVCNILSRLHSADPPVIHRDIKTDNILLTPDGEIYIIDFGIAREYDDAVERDTHVRGTPVTSPPEQFGYSQTDERSDIYAVGVMLTELTTGSVKIDTAGLPKGLAKIIRRCTEFSPDKRYKNAMELGKALEKFMTPKKAPYAVAAAVVLVATLVLTIPKISAALPEHTVDVEESKGATFAEDGSYIFADSAVEAEVRYILGKETESITKADLESISEIKLVGRARNLGWDELIVHGHELYAIDERSTLYGSISVLDDLANMPNLREVILCNQRINDISPLAGSSIRYLSLHGNSIEDISALADCPALERLDISSNPIADISPIAGLYRIYSLNIGATDIKSLDVIAGLSGLQRLEIHDCSLLEDTSALKELKGLTFLSLRPVSAEEIDIISEMTTLENLYMWHAYDLTDLHWLGALKKLRYLGLDAGGLNSLDGIDNFQQLYSLSFRYDHVTDISLLKNIPSLGVICIANNPIDDYSVLGELVHLNEVSCSDSQVDAVTSALGESSNVTLFIG